MTNGAPHKIVIALGSNHGDRRAALNRAVEALQRAGAPVIKKSRLYFTKPWPPDQAHGPWFLNAAVSVRTDLSPTDLLARMNQIESEMGRVRRERWGPRTIDLDLVFYGNVTLDRPGLVVPHPRWMERDFVIAPILDLGAIPPGWPVATARRRLLEALAAADKSIESVDAW